MSERIIKVNSKEMKRMQENAYESIDFGEMEQIVDEVLKNKGNIVVFGTTGVGKTTVLKKLVEKSNQMGIVKNVYLYRMDEIQIGKKEINLLKIKKKT